MISTWIGRIRIDQAAARRTIALSTLVLLLDQKVAYPMDEPSYRTDNGNGASPMNTILTITSPLLALMLALMESFVYNSSLQPLQVGYVDNIAVRECCQYS